jgi:hypothetical protein
VAAKGRGTLLIRLRPTGYGPLRYGEASRLRRGDVTLVSGSCAGAAFVYVASRLVPTKKKVVAGITAGLAVFLSGGFASFVALRYDWLGLASTIGSAVGALFLCFRVLLSSLEAGPDT